MVIALVKGQQHKRHCAERDSVNFFSFLFDAFRLDLLLNIVVADFILFARDQNKWL